MKTIAIANSGKNGGGVSNKRPNPAVNPKSKI